MISRFPACPLPSSLPSPLPSRASRLASRCSALFLKLHSGCKIHLVLVCGGHGLSSPPPHLHLAWNRPPDAGGRPSFFFFFSSRRKINVIGLKNQKFHIQYGPKFLSVVYNAPFPLIIIFKSIYAQRVGCITFYTLILGKRDLLVTQL